MAGSVTGLHVFAADVGPEPLSLLDGNFNPLATAINTLSTFSNYYVDSGAVNALAITVNAPQIVSAYTDGLMVQVQVTNTTTSATPTLAINGLGARTLVRADASSLAVGELVATMRFTAIYDSGLAEFRIISPTAGLPSGPTFNATVTINAVAGKQSLVVNGAANQYAESIVASATSGQSLGLLVSAGTTSADVALLVRNQAASATFLEVFGDGHGTLGPSASLGVSWSATGNVTIAAPSSGTALAVSGNAAGVAVGDIRLSGTNGTIGLLDPGANGAALFLSVTNASGYTINATWTTASAGNLKLQTGNTDRLTIASTGNVVVLAPSSGQALSITGAANSYALSVLSGNVAGQDFGLIIQAGSTSADAPISIVNRANSAAFFTILGDGHGQLGPSASLGLSWTTGGNVTVNTPSSGVPLTVNATAASNIGINVVAASNTTAQINVTNTGAGAATLAVFDLSDGSTTASIAYQASTVTLANSVTHGVAGNAMTLGPIPAVPLLLCTNLTAWMQITGAGALQGWGPTAAAFVDMTPDKSSWSTTISGPWVAGSNPTGTLKWERQGTQVTIWADASILATATIAAAATASGLPAAITPSSNRTVLCAAISDNGNTVLGAVSITTSNTLVFGPVVTRAGANPQELTTSPVSFSGAGSTGIVAQFSITYSL